MTSDILRMPALMRQDRSSFDPALDVSAVVDLRIMETTDLHVHLHPYDYYADCANPDLGLVRLAELVDQARQEVPNTLLFDNGDFLQGTPVGDFFAYDRGIRDGETHPVIAAMNEMRYDGLTLGNHEFNYGLDFLLNSLNRAEFPVVSANISLGLGASARQDRCLTRPYTLLRRDVVDRSGRRHLITVGVIGVAPPQITIWERLQLDGRIFTRDMVDAARAWVPQMREEGADLVVMLAHTGIGPLRHTDGMENALIPLARIEGVDLLLSGHIHQVFPSRIFADIPGIDIDRGTIAGKPTVMSGFFGSHLGLIDLRMAREGGQWRILSHRVETRALRDAAMSFIPAERGPRLQPMRSPRVRSIVARAHEAVLENIRQPIGQTQAPINSFFVFLGQAASTRLVADAQAAFVRERLAGADADLPVLSSVSPSKAGGLAGPRNFTNIAAGCVTLRSLADLYIYPNRIAALRLNGAQVTEWLERAASCFSQLLPGVADTLLVNPGHPAYNFEIIYGLRYAFDLTQPARYDAAGLLLDPSHRRVRYLTLEGTPLDPDAEFIVCTNSFRAHGAGAFIGAIPENVVFEHPAITRDILRDHVAAQGLLQVPTQAPFHLLAGQGTQVVLRTSPAALDHLGAIAAFQPELDGVDKKGFLRVRVTLNAGA